MCPSPWWSIRPPPPQRSLNLLRHRRAQHTPVEIVEKLNRQINAGLTHPKMKTTLSDFGGTLLAGSPADFGKLIIDETEKWANVRASKFSEIRLPLDIP